MLVEKKLRLEVAWAGLEWADAYLLRGKTEDIGRAKELLEAARAEFDDMGANGWVELTDDKLSKIEIIH